MAKYIDKDALVAEIEKLLAFYSKEIEDNKEDPWTMNIAKRDLLQEILSFLNTLEVKEVDLDLEIALWTNAIPEIRLDDIERLAKYFFELGIKAQKGEEV
jgi:hypothetical protein